MTDDFSDVKDSSAFLEDLIAEDSELSPPPRKKSVGKRKTTKSGGFLGMTPIQTFIISAMFFFMVCLFGFFIMVFTEKMVVTF
ncbi:MAG: hypothetical protein PVF83_17795 [Anaerolineales bacterium]|jgi:hypothetical protein